MRVINYEQLKSVLAQQAEWPRIVASGNFAPPMTLLKAADETIENFNLHMLNAHPGIPDREGVDYESAFVGPAMRRHPRLHYIPSRLSMVPILFRDHYRPDIVFLHTSPRRYDTVSLGVEVNILPAAIEAARARNGIVIAQANKQMPYTYGDAQIYESEIDYLIEVDEPLLEKPVAEITDTQREIGDRIAALIENSSTLQLGIGGVPDAVLSALKDRKNMRIWTEMFSDGVLDLFKAGVLDDEMPLNASFLFGSRELYDWVNLNRKIRMRRTETSNDPSLIARQAKMTSINSALQIDLYDQANASFVRGEIYSGFGGSTDFIVGALHSRGGQSFMALPSWHPKANVSTIIPKLDTPVTSFQHSYVATEQGIAPCLGMATSVFDSQGNPAPVNQKGELVCTVPFPSKPIGFWGDKNNEKYLSAYFEGFPGVWTHGDFASISETGGFTLYGRSDATLNSKGVRIGTAEIYRVVETFPQVQECMAVSQDWDNDTRVVLFVVVKDGQNFDEEVAKEIKKALRDQASPRHVPDKILVAPELPRTKSNKLVELAVTDVINGREVRNRDALANPNALDWFKDLPELLK